MVTIDIWSDVLCPFCYIGKRHLEEALDQFPNADKVEVRWHSFQLDPTAVTDESVTAVEHFANKKMMSETQARLMFKRVTEMAAEAGLEFDIENSVIANSFNAHRLIQLAGTKGLDNEVEEALFKAHFIEGKNIDNKEVLAEIGIKVGIDEKEVNDVLSSDLFSEEVKADINRAQDMGVNGVPFFVFNNKYAVSGAHPLEVFKSALDQTYREYEAKNQPIVISEGDSCTTDGVCD